jgi:hypothetical protein
MEGSRRCLWQIKIGESIHCPWEFMNNESRHNLNKWWHGFDRRDPRSGKAWGHARRAGHASRSLNPGNLGECIFFRRSYRWKSLTGFTSRIWSCESQKYSPWHLSQNSETAKESGTDPPAWFISAGWSRKSKKSHGNSDKYAIRSDWKSKNEDEKQTNGLTGYNNSVSSWESARLTFGDWWWSGIDSKGLSRLLQPTLRLHCMLSLRNTVDIKWFSWCGTFSWKYWVEMEKSAQCTI